VAFFWLPMLSGLPLLGATVGGIAGWRRGFIYGLRGIFFTLLSSAAALAVSLPLTVHLANRLATAELGTISVVSPTLQAATRQIPEAFLFPVVFLGTFLLLRLAVFLFSDHRTSGNNTPVLRFLGVLTGACAHALSALVLAAALTGILAVASFHPAVAQRDETLCKRQNLTATLPLASVLWEALLPRGLSRCFSVHTGDTVYPLREETQLIRTVFALAAKKTPLLSEDLLETMGASPLGRQILWELLVYLRDDGGALSEALSPSPVAAVLLEETHFFLKESTKETAPEDLALILGAYRLTEAYHLQDAEDPQALLLETDFLPALLALLDENPRFSALKNAAVDRLLSSLPIAEKPWFSLALTLLPTVVGKAESRDDVMNLLETAAYLADISVNDSVIACLSDYFCDVSCAEP